MIQFTVSNNIHVVKIPDFTSSELRKNIKKNVKNAIFLHLSNDDIWAKADRGPKSFWISLSLTESYSWPKDEVKRRPTLGYVPSLAVCYTILMSYFNLFKNRYD